MSLMYIGSDYEGRDARPVSRENPMPVELLGQVSDGTAGTAIIGKVGIDQVTANANEVVVKSITAGDTNIGNVDLASAIPAGDNNIGNVDLASAIPTGTNTIGATTDAGPAWTNSRLFTASADMTGAADLTAAPTAGQKIVVDDLVVSTDTAMYISFLEETSGTEMARLYLPANGSAQVTIRGKWKLDTADKKLRGDASAAGNVAVTCWYHSET